MARPRLAESARVPIGLKVSEADAARIDEVLTRPEFTGWSRSEWCREIIRTALRYYVGEASTPEADQAPAPPDTPQAVSPGQPAMSTDGRSPAPAAATSSPATLARSGETVSAAPEPPGQPDCPHPSGARDYQTGTCASCGAILWD